MNLIGGILMRGIIRSVAQITFSIQQCKHRMVCSFFRQAVRFFNILNDVADIQRFISEFKKDTTFEYPLSLFYFYIFSFHDFVSFRSFGGIVLKIYEIDQLSTSNIQGSISSGLSDSTDSSTNRLLNKGLLIIQSSRSKALSASAVSK